MISETLFVFVHRFNFYTGHIDGLVQYWINSIANALELLQPWTKPVKWGLDLQDIQWRDSNNGTHDKLLLDFGN